MQYKDQHSSRLGRFIELNWGILLVLVAWELWVVIITFFPSFVFTTAGLRSLPAQKPGSVLCFRRLQIGDVASASSACRDS